jgi:four helix bundle protein
METKRIPVNRFEDLIAWQKARQLTKVIYQITRNSTFAADYHLASQIQRAAVSIMSNIAEGCDRASTKEFLRFLITAKSSCAEVRSHLRVARDISYLSEATYLDINAKAPEISKIIGGLHRSISKKVLDQKVKLRPNSGH